CSGLAGLHRFSPGFGCPGPNPARSRRPGAHPAPRRPPGARTSAPARSLAHRFGSRSPPSAAPGLPRCRHPGGTEGADRCRLRRGTDARWRPSRPLSIPHVSERLPGVAVVRPDAGAAERPVGIVRTARRHAAAEDAMTTPTLGGSLLGRADPHRSRGGCRAAFACEPNEGGFIRCGGVAVLIDGRVDVAAANP
ncbi:MAG: hypothetical protein AVDCRST_MAG19-4307, partial [uncultured Thermomicrobiales bacterium]